MAKVGRPTEYSQELAEEICMAIACTAKGLRKLCKEHQHWPNRVSLITLSNALSLNSNHIN